MRERNRIAREIHDNVGHMLTRAILMVGALRTTHPEPDLAVSLSLLNDTLDQAMNSIRPVSYTHLSALCIVWLHHHDTRHRDYGI